MSSVAALKIVFMLKFTDSIKENFLKEFYIV